MSRSSLGHSATADVPHRRSSRVFQSLHHEGYAALWSANLCWEFAWWIEVVAGGWLVLTTTNSVWLLAVAGFARTIPIPLLSIVAGAAADRFPRRALLIGLQILDCAIMLSLTALLVAGRLVYWQIIVAAVILGIARALDWPARRALAMDLVGHAAVGNAMALESFAIQVATILGPVIAGAVLARGGAAGAYGLLGLLYAASLVPLARVPRAAAARLSGGPDWRSRARDIREGLGFARQDSAVRMVLTMTLIASFTVIPFLAFLPIVARDVLGVGPLGLGLLTAAGGVGAAASSLVVASMGASGARERIFLASAALMAVFLLLFALSPLFALSLVLLVLLGVANGVYTARQSAIVLSQARPEMRGRLMSLVFLAVGCAPLGILAMGSAVARWGAPGGLAGGGLAGALLATLVALRASRPAAPLRPVPERPPATDSGRDSEITRSNPRPPRRARAG
ncbi:MAG: MFS transporter [Chloroflexota bacterium]